MMEFGWHTNKSTKPLMIDELGGAIRDGAITVWSAGALGELRTYVRDERGSMGGSPYDDRVMSLAIATQMLNYAWAPEYKQEDSNYFTVSWFSSLSSSGDQQDSGWTIGKHSVRQLV